MTVEAAEHAPTASEYIVHHLGHLSTHHQTKIVDFSILNVDTIFWSVFCGVIACFFMFLAARKATSGVPGRFQAFVEMVVEMVEDQSKAIVHGDRTFIAPLALTVFVWVALMNSWTSCRWTWPPASWACSAWVKCTTASFPPPTSTARWASPSACWP
jgi:F-type H+-transporting ATPase subunit a